MNIETLFDSAKTDLDTAKESLSAEDFDSTLSLLGNAYADVRALLEAVWCRKRAAQLAAQPPGENVQ